MIGGKKLTMCCYVGFQWHPSRILMSMGLGIKIVQTSKNSHSALVSSKTAVLYQIFLGKQGHLSMSPVILVSRHAPVARLPPSPSSPPIQTCSEFLIILFIVKDNTSWLVMWNDRWMNSYGRTSKLESISFDDKYDSEKLIACLDERHATGMKSPPSPSSPPIQTCSEFLTVLFIIKDKKLQNLLRRTGKQVNSYW
ncbi:hypothetical protein C8R48DRAFT_674016 [Suillus tomentosus]|nr:hypothetical protein C8R48DRAFT_674016 [Suillus tomentosus]